MKANLLFILFLIPLLSEESVAQTQTYRFGRAAGDSTSSLIDTIEVISTVTDAKTGTLWRTTVYHGLLRSLDRGETWKHIDQVHSLPTGWTYSRVIVDTQVNAIFVVFVGPYGAKVYSSTDGGGDWEYIHKGLPPEGDHTIAAVDSEGEIWMANNTDGSSILYRLDREKSRWEPFPTLRIDGSVSALTFSGSRMFLGAGLDYEEILYVKSARENNLTMHYGVDGRVGVRSLLVTSRGDVVVWYQGDGNELELHPMSGASPLYLSPSGVFHFWINENDVMFLDPYNGDRMISTDNGRSWEVYPFTMPW